MRLTSGKRDEIRSTIAWIQVHLQRGDKAPNAAISAEHDRLVSDKYMHELADHFGCVLIRKEKYNENHKS